MAPSLPSARAPRLRYALLELGLKCNLRCRHCASQAGAPRPSELTGEEWDAVVDDLAALGCRAVDLMGGEVLLSPLLDRVGGRLQQAGIPWGLLTNGWLLDARRAGHLLDLGCRGFGVSLDGAVAKTHDALRGLAGSFERALRAIDVVAKLDLAPKNRAVITSVTARNLDELPRLGELLSRRAPGVRWQLNLCSALTPRFPATERVDAQGIARVRDFIAEARRARRYDLLLGAAHDLGYFIDEPALRDSRWDGCPAGREHAGVQSDGVVKGCLILDESYGVGNVRKRRLSELWNDAAAMARYREVRVEDLGEGCRACVWAAICRGGCTAHSVAWTGRPHQHPHCLWRDASQEERAAAKRPVVASGQRPRTGARPRRTAWLTPLRSVCVELTRRCNLRCLHCGSAAGAERTSELTEAEWGAVFDDVARLGGERVVLLGGEPLLHPGWDRLVARAREAGLDAALITNGYRVSQAMAARMAAGGLSHVGVSVDGASDEVHDTIRGAKGARQRAWAALRRLRAAGLPVTVITTVMRTNLPELAALRDQLLAEGHGLVWQLQAAAAGGERFPEGMALDPAGLLAVARFISACRKSLSLDQLAVAGAHDIGYFAETVCDYGTLGEWRGCPGGITSAGIASDGSLKPCLSMGDAEVQGNVRERPLRRLWRDPRLFERNRFPAPGRLQGGCARCPYGALCRAGCPQSARTSTGDVHDNPLCLRRAEQA